MKRLWTWKHHIAAARLGTRNVGKKTKNLKEKKKSYTKKIKIKENGLEKGIQNMFERHKSLISKEQPKSGK